MSNVASVSLLGFAMSAVLKRQFGYVVIVIFLIVLGVLLKVGCVLVAV